MSFGIAFQRFTFDTIEGLDLGKVPAVFSHDNAFLLGGREDVVTTLNSIEATVNQLTTFVTVGVTDRLDLSVALPLLANDLTVVSDATIQRLGTTDPLTHFFRQSTGEVGTRRIFTAVGSASGVGDLMVRAKQTLMTERIDRPGGRAGRARADRRCHEPARHRHGRPAAVRRVVRDLQQGLSARQRQLPVERLQRAGRQSGDRDSLRTFPTRSRTSRARISA